MYQGGSRPERDWWQDAQRQEEERRQEAKARRAEEHLLGRVSPEPLDMEGVEPITRFRP
jgi:hypothetical protein